MSEQNFAAEARVKIFRAHTPADKPVAIDEGKIIAVGQAMPGSLTGVMEVLSEHLYPNETHKFAPCTEGWRMVFVDTGTGLPFCDEKGAIWQFEPLT